MLSDICTTMDKMDVKHPNITHNNILSGIDDVRKLHTADIVKC